MCFSDFSVKKSAWRRWRSMLWETHALWPQSLNLNNASTFPPCHAPVKIQYMICFNVAHHGMSGANWAGSASTWIGKTRQDHIHPNIASWLKYFGTWITCLGCKCCSSPGTVEQELDSFGWCGSDQLTPKHLSADFRYILQSVVVADEQSSGSPTVECQVTVGCHGPNFFSLFVT